MQEDRGNQSMGFIIAGTVLTLLFLYGIHTFFEKTALAAKLLSAGGSVLLLGLIIPFWIGVFKMSVGDGRVKE